MQCLKFTGTTRGNGRVGRQKMRISSHVGQGCKAGNIPLLSGTFLQLGSRWRTFVNEPSGASPRRSLTYMGTTHKNDGLET